MRIIDADRLLKEMKQVDLDGMNQVCIVDCLENLIKNQPTVSKEINIENVKVFDNRRNVR